MLQLVNKFDDELKKVFLQAIKKIKGPQLVRLVERGDLRGALALIEESASILGTKYGDALEESARAASSWLNDKATVVVGARGDGFVFDNQHVRFVRNLEQNKFRLVTQFTNDQREMLQQTLSRGAAEGLNPRASARQVRQNIGLTDKQATYVDNYRRELEGVGRTKRPGDLHRAQGRTLHDRRFDSTIERAQANQQPLTKAQIDKMVNRYRERYVGYRARVIARTESLRAVHEGTEEMYQQAIESGDLDAGDLTRTWVTAADERVRSSHASLNGEQRAVGQPWGNLRYPGDPTAPAEETVQCRCVLTTRMS